MKKIKIVTYENFPFGGASANFLRYLAFALTQEKHEVEVIKPNGYIYGGNKNPKNQRVGEINNVKFRYIGLTKNHPRCVIGKIVSSIWAFCFTPLFLMLSYFHSKYQMLICYNTRLYAVLPLLVLKCFFKLKFLLIIPEYYRKPNSGIIKKILWYNFYIGLNYFAKYADGYVVLTSYMYEYLSDNLKIKKPIYILPNIMDPKHFEMPSVEPYKANKITIGYVGTPTTKDGINDLLKSFSLLNKKYPETHLLIIGDTPGHCSVIPDLMNEVKELDISESTSFTGLVSFNEVAILMNSCQVLALTRPNGVFAQAGFPTKLGEYFACKKPVLLTDVGDIPKYFENYKHAVIAKAENVDDIAAGFEKIISDKELSLNLAKNSYKWMDDNLNYRSVAIKLSQFIAEV